MVKENAINALEKNPKIIPDENNNIDSNDSSKDLKEYDDNPEILKINLLNKVKDLTPYDFEKLCIKIICNVYQVNEEELSELTKKSHDGGIDGIVSLDPLGFKKIYIQAKRYDGANVTDRIVRDFAGALDGKKADGGVIITTSKFNNAARITAERSEYNIILIDDDKLINLMIENKIGVRVKKTIEILDISDDFFDELQSDNDE
jgi:restriction system protein